MVMSRRAMYRCTGGCGRVEEMALGFIERYCQAKCWRCGKVTVWEIVSPPTLEGHLSPPAATSVQTVDVSVETPKFTAPQAPAEEPDAETRRGRVLAVLQAADGGWVDGPELASPEVGGSEGLRRLRELRSAGWNIESRRHPDGWHRWQYRIVDSGAPWAMRPLTGEAP